MTNQPNKPEPTLQINLRPATINDNDLCFRVKKVSHRENIVATHGPWDENFQRQFHEKNWRPEGVWIIQVNGEEAGTFAYSEQEDHFAVEGLYLLSSYQRLGVGTELLALLQEKAGKVGKPVRLRVMKKNVAVEFYEKIGFLRIGETKTHLVMERV